MQFKIPTPAAPDMSRLTAALADADPAAVVDFDAAHAVLRLSSYLQPVQIATVLSQAGLPTQEAQVAKIPSDCCGGCGG
ncbi:hypothetical protein GCM10008101_08140 [Lysobacter xinjiangensis]|uniref:HMA domain-containing protein n=1 Tax=Cognatilysobacter xinjiangensis TaxID=546892 RepID=A0ABQ3BWQ3_9GAMM|nr:hypothetical protein [Lysobacter xinjiangensis]GGZ57008.1 hypothetical protein GCM10008101_08140 [Lysobacter xinjiangensis]